MWQRIQTLFLGIAVVASLLLFVFPFGTFSGPEGEVTYSTTAINGPGEASSVPWGVLVLNVLGILLNVAAIALYKNRPSQLKILRLNMVFATGVLATAVLYLDTAASPFADAASMETSYHPVGLLLPLLALVFTFLANRAIKKDEALVRSMDRLR